MSKLNICIIGLGLIGASLGLAIKKHLQNDVYIIGIDRAIVTTNFAVENNFVDYASNLIDENIKKADIVFWYFTLTINSNVVGFDKFLVYKAEMRWK